MTAVRRIAWVSRHAPLPAQLREIARLFPGATLVDAGAHFRNAEDLITRLDDLGADAAVVVLPLSMIARAVELRPDIQWIWSEMAQVHEGCPGPDYCPLFDPETDAWLPGARGEPGRHVRFIGFRRIAEVRVVLEPLEPAGAGGEPS